MSKSPILFSSDDEDEVPLKEREILRKFQSMLQGIPPPTSVTMSKLSVTEMLGKYKENECLFSVKSPECKHDRIFSPKNNATPLVYYLNSSQTSEEIANLSQKVQSRYIYSETLSTCNVWFDEDCAKKHGIHRKGFGMSPGSRLSHLARRRQIFSCENLQQLAKFERRRYIEIRQNSASEKTQKTVQISKLNSSKRALFQSPEDEEKHKNCVNDSVRRKLFSKSEKLYYNGNSINNSSQQQNTIERPTRKRNECRNSNGSWPRRALTFTEEDVDKNQNSKSSKVISEIQLSLHHKSKLLWAVSSTLKEKNMVSKHPQFKTCASALFMICRKNLGKILNSKVEGGTSEKMLKFAKEHVEGIFRKLNINANQLGEVRNVDVLGVRNDANTSVSIEETKNSMSKNLAVSYDNVSDFGYSSSESSLISVSENDVVQTHIIEKENIDI